MRPRNIILVEDGAKDDTVPRAREYAAAAGLNLTVFERAASIGKTPTIKRQAREFDSDVEFILDGDTFLESPNYIERCVQELYQGVGIASACGTILPMRPINRHALAQTDEFKRWHGAQTYDDPHARRGMLHGVWWWVTNTYRECLYMFLQRFVYKGQMVFFGSITNPVGCAVAYRRKYIKNLFDRYEPIFGDDLTNSEDIFIGFALNNEGYRNIQLQDVLARSEEPEVQRLPRQVYLWSSSFLQSCYYFDELMRTPFKSVKLWRKKRRDKASGEAQRIDELRKVKEQYRQPFGEKYTTRIRAPDRLGVVPRRDGKDRLPDRDHHPGDPAHVGAAGGDDPRRDDRVAVRAGGGGQGPATADAVQGHRHDAAALCVDGGRHRDDRPFRRRPLDHGEPQMAQMKTLAVAIGALLALPAVAWAQAGARRARGAGTARH